jgi:hypothetical protein
MSIQHSEATCDWCSKKIGDGVDVACHKCYGELEGECGRLQDTIAELEGKISDLESRLP